jgi:hypothetical protein
MIFLSRKESRFTDHDRLLQKNVTNDSRLRRECAGKDSALLKQVMSFTIRGDLGIGANDVDGRDAGLKQLGLLAMSHDQRHQIAGPAARWPSGVCGAATMQHFNLYAGS